MYSDRLFVYQCFSYPCGLNLFFNTCKLYFKLISFASLISKFLSCVSKQRVYQKDYNQTKTKIHIPSDIIANQVAKRCQDMLSDVLYRTYLHQWTCHPEQEDAIRARKTNEILSDVGPSSVHVCRLVVPDCCARSRTNLYYMKYYMKHYLDIIQNLLSLYLYKRQKCYYTSHINRCFYLQANI